MIELNIPGRGILQLEYLVFDVNGTLALDGKLLDGMARSLSGLSDRLQLYLITADTRGRQDNIDQQLGITAIRLQPGQESEQKASFVRQLGSAHVAAVGQGANDAAMLKEAALGICIISNEGTAVETLMSADLVLPDIYNALELFEKPIRLVATLRK
jgi:P-type E1-E2 ATPase